MIEQMIIDIIAHILDIDAEQINENSLILDELGANSLDIIEIVTEIEDSLHISIPDEIIPGIKTVGELIEYTDSQK